MEKSINTVSQKLRLKKYDYFQAISEKCDRKGSVETGQKTHDKLSIGLPRLHT